MLKISAILLAAGSSKRMGKENKLLLPFGKNSIFQQCFDQLIHSQIFEIIVVTGYQNQSFDHSFNGENVSIAFNPNYNEGMTSSIKAGIKESNHLADGFMICLADMPFMTTVDYNHIIESANLNYQDPFITVPIFEGEKGNPVIFSKSFKHQILNHKEVNGCKLIIDTHKEQTHFVKMENNHILSDIDTKADYKKYLK